MYRFVLSPRWLLTHIVILLIGAGCAAAGLWQLDRLEIRRERNELLISRSAEPPVPVTEVRPGEAEFRSVTMSGTFDAAREVLLTGRGRDGAPGNHVLTPLVLDDGRALLVDRGWVPASHDRPPVAEAAPPVGRVELTGLARDSQAPTFLGPRNAGEGVLTTVALVDVGRLGRQMPYELLAVWAMATDGPRGADELPLAPALPVLTEGRHLAYAAQWFLFVPVGLTGYAFILRREARRRRRIKALEAASRRTARIAETQAEPG